MKIKDEYSSLNKVNLKWAIEFLSVFTVLFIISLFVYNEIYYFSFILAVNLFIGIEGIHYRSVHAELRSNLDSRPKEINPKELVSRSAGLPDHEKERLFSRLMEHMQQHKRFLDPDLRLSDIADELKTNRQYLSQVINHKTSESFYHFVNKYRVDEFIIRLQSEEYRNMSIEGIANNVGFNSKSAFYSAFRKEKGCTPKSFMKKGG
ncbi:MAG: helix-turn-helix domain-containing protein [Bacteroidota bacterium]